MESDVKTAGKWPELTEQESLDQCGALIDFWLETDPDARFILEFMKPIGHEIRKVDCQYWPHLFNTHYIALKGMLNALDDGPVDIKKIH